MIIRSEHDLLRRKAELARVLRAQLGPDCLATGGSDRLALVFDLEMHLAFLGEAVRLQVPRLFTEYAGWTHELLLSSDKQGQRFRSCLDALSDLLRSRAEGEWVAPALAMLATAREGLADQPRDSPSHWHDDNPHRALGEGFLQACLHLRRRQALSLVQQAVAGGVPIPAIYTQVITPALRELGRLWQLNRVSVAQEHYCTAVAQMAMAQLFPVIFDSRSQAVGRLVSACVAGELHEIGARMVADQFEIAGWDTVFLGADVPPASVVDMLVETDAQVLALSVTLAAHLGDASRLIDSVRATPDCASVKILAGGAAFNLDASVWQKMGCDGWAPDATAALELAGHWSH